MTIGRGEGEGEGDGEGRRRRRRRRSKKIFACGDDAKGHAEKTQAEGQHWEKSLESYSEAWGRRRRGPSSAGCSCRGGGEVSIF